MHDLPMSKFNTILSQCVLENVGNGTETVLVTLIASNKSNLIKILVLLLMS